MQFEHGNAICYSGYREGQSPQTRVLPDDDQIREDLLILAKNWRVPASVRLQPACRTRAQVIRDEGLHYKSCWASTWRRK